MPALRIVLSLFLIILLSLFIVSPAYAEAKTCQQARAEAQCLDSNGNIKPEGCPLLPECYNYLTHGQTATEGSIGHAILCSVAGFSPIDNCAGYKKETKDGKAKLMVYSQVPGGGALGATGSLIATLYTNKPISSTYYLARMGQEIGIVPQEAYAQNLPGSGAGLLEPVLNFWLVTRNIAYMVFILVFIVVGIMIMFRQKINPQTVISAQQAMPSLIIGLLLVTFSYFISALLVDLLYVGMQLIVGIFGMTGIQSAYGNQEAIQNLARNSNILQLFGTVAFNGEAWSKIRSAIPGQAYNLFGGAIGAHALTTMIGAIIAAVVISLPAALVGAAIGAVALQIIPIILIIILVLALFIQLMRLAFSLLNAYLQILIFTVTGPIYILIGSIPGRSATISIWWKGVLANSLIFPAVFAVFLLAGMILGPSMTFNARLPFFADVNSDFVKVLLAYALLLGSPAIPEMVRAAFKVQGPQAIVGQALGGFMAGVGAAQPMGAGIGRFGAGTLAHWLIGPSVRNSRWFGQAQRRLEGLSTPPRRQ